MMGPWRGKGEGVILGALPRTHTEGGCTKANQSTPSPSSKLGESLAVLKRSKQDEVRVRRSDTKVFTGAKFNRGAHKVIFQVACCSWDPIIISCDL